MSGISRRTVIAGVAGMGLLAACNNGLQGNGAEVIDARVDSTLQYMTANIPGARDLMDKAAGMLVMPLITEAGFGLGGAFGRGALRVGGVSVDYYMATQASVGLQIGAQQYSHVLFFMTPEALADFRNSPGWTAGADVKYALNDRGEAISADTVTATSPVVAVVFGQAGLIAGATIKGTKYTRIIP